MSATIRKGKRNAGTVRTREGSHDRGPSSAGIGTMETTTSFPARPTGGGIVRGALRFRAIHFVSHPKAFEWSDKMIESFLYDIFPAISETFDLNTKMVSSSRISLMKLVNYSIGELKAHSNNNIEYILGQNGEELLVGKRTYLTSFFHGYCFEAKYIYMLKEYDPMLYRAYLAICHIIEVMGGVTWDAYFDYILEPMKDMLEERRENVRLGNLEKPDVDKKWFEKQQKDVDYYETGDPAIFLQDMRKLEDPAFILRHEISLDPNNKIHQEFIPIIELALSLFNSGMDYKKFRDVFIDEENMDGIGGEEVFGIIWDAEDDFGIQQDEYFTGRFGEFGVSNMCMWERLSVTGSLEGTWFVEQLEKMFMLLNNHVLKIEVYAKNLCRSIQDITPGNDLDYLPG